MTLSCNFPHRKYARRVSALGRLEKQVEWVDLALEGGMSTEHKVKAVSIKKRIDAEIAILQKRTAGSGNKVSTKKVGQNLGWKGLTR